MSAEGPPRGARPPGGNRRAAPIGGSQTIAEGPVRFDKWLWAARFYKTRSLAVQAIEAGQARIGDERVKPARMLRVADVVSVRKSSIVWVVDVLRLSDRRGGAADAALLYVERPDSVRAREDRLQELRAARDAVGQPAGRPTKRQRRKLADFLNEP